MPTRLPRSINELSHEFALELSGQLVAGELRPLPLKLPDLRGTPCQAVFEVFSLSAEERLILFLAATTQLNTGLMLQTCAAELELSGSDKTLSAFLCPYVIQQWFGPLDPAVFAASSPLRQMNLLELHPTHFGNGSGSDLLSEIRIAPGALAFMQGGKALSSELSPLLTPLGSWAWLGHSQQAALAELSEVMQLSGPDDLVPVINIYSASPAAALEVAQMYSAPISGMPDSAVSDSGAGGWLLDFGQVERRVQQGKWSVEALLGLLQRDFTYLGATLVIRLEEQGDLNEAASSPLTAQGWSPLAFAQALCGSLQTPLILLSRDPLVFESPRDLYAVAAERPTPEEQVEFWSDALGLGALTQRQSEVAAEFRHLTTQFSLSSQTIATVARDAQRHLQQRGVADSDDLELLAEVWEACKRQGRKAFQGIAEQVPTGADWESLILPPEDLLTLRDIVTQVQHRHEVYRAWGYTSAERGLGITALFSGTSGGGKTYAAEVLATALNLDLYRIDLSSVSSKWIGETEKNLKKVFDAADEGGAILLFDEADSVFGKRGEAQSSNDRYANLTTNYLLQRMESYRGLAILTTNYEGNIDSAFMRRIRFTVRFREPDEALRLQLWQRAFPAGVEVSALDYKALARPKLTGANVKSIALNASFLARARGEAVTTTLIEEAISRELRRQGRLVFSQ
ncbi:ATP-binding protein (plasmid) [Deinococcus psychrotolerans]|uniref:ATP-binding protein n=1 Tax=Deinococcus psychrotolerans TaxID=2489213 RepID=A0A3G8YGL7_9DEIO|nr:ATP-binding protein [Deinococcus psychrotolerans]AZI44479.1 ATP-binding protein [Deinococcus psychrotolerans]